MESASKEISVLIVIALRISLVSSLLQKDSVTINRTASKNIYIFITNRFAHKRLSREEMTKFIHDNKQYLLEERQKYGKTKIDRYIDEYLKKENYYQSKNFAQNFYNGTQADILTINNANNIILNYQLMNNALLTGAISLMNMNYFPVEHLGYQNLMFQTMPQGEQSVKKEEEKSNEIPKEREEDSKTNEDGPKDPRIRNKK